MIQFSQKSLDHLSNFQEPIFYILVARREHDKITSADNSRKPTATSGIVSLWNQEKDLISTKLDEAVHK